MTVALSPERKRELLVGALELALLDRIRQEYVDNISIQTLFVVDFPKMAHIHCLPPVNLSIVETTGFLSAPKRNEAERSNSRAPDHANFAFMRQLAKAHPTALGLTEVLARFVFDRSWSDGQPKLMLPTQTKEAALLEGAILNAALSEWSDASSQAHRMSSILQKISREHRDSVSEFVNAVIGEAEKSMPELYGEYSRTRQHLRFSDVKPLPFGDVQSRPVMFAHAISEVRQYLIELEEDGRKYSNFSKNVASWQRALQRVLPSDEAHREERRTADAKTLATIEFLNERFAEDKVNCRVVYLTSHSALTDVAALHFNKMSFRDLTPPRDICGSRQSFSRTRYNAWLITDREIMGRVPILDPRALMTDRRFVEYAISDVEQDPAKEKRRAITEWLPLFFNGQEQDSRLLADSYFAMQRVKNSEHHRILREDSFDSGQYSALINSWDEYIKTISAGYGLSKANANSSIRSLLKTIVSGSADAITSEIKSRLEATLREWLPAVGGATFAQMRDAQVTQKEIIRSVPPLIMPAFDKMQRSFLAILGDNEPLSLRNGSANDLEWLTNPTVKTLGLPKEWANSEQWRLDYVHSLGLSYGFAIEENWTASYRLAEITYSIARGNSSGDNMRDPKFISGREAAFLRSFAARRRMATRPLITTVAVREHRYIHDIKFAWTSESKWFLDQNWTDRIEVHELRIEGEVLAWRVFRLLSGLAMRHNVFAPLRFSEGGLNDIEDVLTGLIHNSSSSQALCEKFEQVVDSENCDGLAYFAATFYLARQSLLSALQLIIFSDSKIFKPKANQILEILGSLEKLSPERTIRFKLNMPWSNFERRLIFISASRINSVLFADLVSSRPSENPIDPPTIQNADSDRHFERTLVGWREKMLDRALVEFK